MNKLVSVLMLLALLGCSQGDVPADSADSQTVKRGQDAGASVPFGVASAAGVSGTAYESRIRQQGSFADLPDRGELLSYPSRTGGQGALIEGAYTWHRVDVSEEHALRAIVSGHLRIPTPSGQALDIRYDYHVEHPSGDLSWIGHVEGQPSLRTVLTFGADAVFGKIGQQGKRSLRLTMRNGAAWLVETDPAKLAILASSRAHARTSDALPVPKQRRTFTEATPLVQPAAAQAVTTAAATTTIDLLVGYTPGFLSTWGTASAAVTRLNEMVAVGNDALAASQVNARIRLVRAMQVNYTDASTNESTLEQLTGYDTATDDYTTPNAAFNALRAARETYGADVVTLVRAFRDPEQDGCGIAWLNGGGQSGIAPNDGHDYFGYSVVSDGHDDNYFCREETLIHEVAHNIGSQHDRETAKDGDGVLNPDDYGAFAYSFGWKTGVSAGNFYTIMAYGDEGQQDYPFFSSPRLTTQCGGRACGTANDDNARSLTALAPVVATFRTMVLPIGGVDDFNGDGLADVAWRNYQTGADAIWSGGNSASRLPIANVTVVSWRIVGSGDFNADGRADLLWRDNASGANTIWLSANAATRSLVATVPARAWIVAGVGDFNGDTRADILWRNTANGANTIWRSGNSATPQMVATVSNLAWQIAAVGDFNADRRADIVWRDRSTGTNVVWLSGNFSTRMALATVADRRWFISGAGDLDGNGADDLVWRHSSTGANSVWPAANASRGVNFTAVTDVRWQVERIADYNGDGRDDLLWRNAATGAGTIWFSANFATRRAISSVPGPYWQIVP